MPPLSRGESKNPLCFRDRKSKTKDTKHTAKHRALSSLKVDLRNVRLFKRKVQLLIQTNQSSCRHNVGLDCVWIVLGLCLCLFCLVVEQQLHCSSSCLAFCPSFFFTRYRMVGMLYW